MGHPELFIENPKFGYRGSLSEWGLSVQRGHDSRSQRGKDMGWAYFSLWLMIAGG